MNTSYDRLNEMRDLLESCLIAPVLAHSASGTLRRRARWVRVQIGLLRSPEAFSRYFWGALARRGDAWAEFDAEGFLTLEDLASAFRRIEED